MSGRTRTFGLLVGDISNPFYPQLARSIEQAASEIGYALVICNTDDDKALTRRYVQRLVDQRIEGIIHASVTDDDAEIDELLSNGTPIVYTNRRPQSPTASYIVGDNVAGAMALTRHLVERGHSRIAFVCGPSYASNARERVDGFLAAARQFEHIGEPLVVPGSGFDRESGHRAARELLALPEPPTAIIGVNDSVALGVLETVTDLGWCVPDDVAVAGFDDIELASSTLVSLTSVATPIAEIGRRTVRALRILLTGKRPNGIREVFEPTLLVRCSTVCGMRDRAGPLVDHACSRRRDGEVCHA